MTHTKKLVLLVTSVVIALAVAVIALTPVGDPLRMAVGAPTTIAHDRVEQVADDPVFTDPRVAESVEKSPAHTTLFFGRYPADGFVRVRNYPTIADPNTDPLIACLEVQDDLVRAGWKLSKSCFAEPSPTSLEIIYYTAYAVRTFESFCAVTSVRVFPNSPSIPSISTAIPFDTNYDPGRYDDCQALLLEEPLVPPASEPGP